MLKRVFAWTALAVFAGCNAPDANLAAIPTGVANVAPASTPNPSTAAMVKADQYFTAPASDASAYFCAGKSALDVPQFYAAQIYFDVLKRLPTIAELQASVPAAKSAFNSCQSNANVFSCVWKAYADLTLTAISSAESVTLNGSTTSNTAFINFIYPLYKGSAPSAAQATSLQNALSAGTSTRRDILVSLLTSSDYRKKFFWEKRCGYPVMGVNAHSMTQEPYLESNGPSYDAQLALIVSLGMREVRIGVANPVDTATLNKALKFTAAAATHHVDVLMDILPSASTSLTLDQIYANAYTYASTLAAQLKGRVKTYELSNERDSVALLSGLSGKSVSDYDPDLIARWSAAFKGASDGVHFADPDAQTMVDFGFTHYGFIQAILAQGVSLDVIALHWYQNMGSKACPQSSYPCSVTTSNVVDKIKAIAPAKPIRITEMGYTPPDTQPAGYTQDMLDAKQRDYTFNVTLENLHRPDLYPIDRYDIYELISEENKTSYRESNYGLFHLNTSSDGSTYSIGAAKPIVALLPLLFDR